MARCVVVVTGVFLFCLSLLFIFRQQRYKVLKAWTTRHDRAATREQCSDTYYGQSISKLSSPSRVDPKALLKLVIIGAGPTGLGAANRLYELGILRANTQIVVLEAQSKPGGLAISQRDDKGFLWDMGGHVVFSHYLYFDDLLNSAVSEWNRHTRASYAFMQGSSGNRSFIPYPVQMNVLAMDKLDQERILRDIHNLSNKSASQTYITNFDEWLLRTFGKELCDFFLRKYNQKVWTVDPKEMNYVWVGDRVAVPSIEEIKAKKKEKKAWGPNRFFRFPKYGGTGAIWQSIANKLPKGWFHFGHRVNEIDIKNKTLNIIVSNDPKKQYNISYDFLISTAPIDVLVKSDKTNNFLEQKKASGRLIFTRTHIIGVGLKGKVPEPLADKSWVYFPDSDSPFYRVTVFSSYSEDHVPDPKRFWSLMCETAQPQSVKNKEQWSKANIINATISALIRYGFITKDQVVSTWYHKLEHGYPVPSLSRESVVTSLQGWLQSHGVYSRGRFGGWRYEVANQDHSVLQGVEVVDLLMRGIPEVTYWKPNLVNSKKSPDRRIKPRKIGCMTLDYEIVAAHYDENLDWLLPHAKHCHIYHKGGSSTPDLRFKQWEKLPNVGRESHTYLHHITSNYNHLANITLFVQGSIKQHLQKEQTYKDLMEYINEARLTSYSVRRHSYLDTWGRLSLRGKWNKERRVHKIRMSNYTLGEFWYKAFGTPHPYTTEWNSGGFFAVSRDRILSRSREFYAHLLTFVDDHPNPEEGHYFERSWHGVFFGY